MRLNPAALRVVRSLSGYSQSSLARASGVSQGHISQLESGDKKAGPSTMLKLARALKVPVGAIVDASCGDPRSAKKKNCCDTQGFH